MELGHATERATPPRSLQVVRLRLPDHGKYLYILRQLGGIVDPIRYPGAEPLLSSRDGVIAAGSPRRLLAEQVQVPQFDGEWFPSMLVLDVRRVGRALERAVEHWSAETRGAIADFDDLCWDAAASVDDAVWGTRLRDPEGPHALYNYIWGDTDLAPFASVRCAMWRELTRQFTDHLDILAASIQPRSRRKAPAERSRR